jgi:membrane fusion protein (multidrug efflux system)
MVPAAIESPETLNRQTRIFCASALLCGLSAVSACGGEDAAAPPPDLIVIVTPVEAHRLEIEIQATGELQAVERSEIAAELSGRVTELLCDEGDAVVQDDVMLRIDPERREIAVSSAQASFGEARAARSEARREHARILKLNAQGAASSAQLDGAATAVESASARLQAAKAQLGEAQRALSDAEVRAPFPGVVDRRLVGRGEYVGPGTPLFTLVANDPLEVVFHLSEVDSARVALGNPVDVYVASHPDDRFTAHVTMIAPTIDSRTRTLRVKGELENGEGWLRPGLFARVDLGVAVRESVPMIPEEAVLQRAAGPIVFMVGSDGRVAQQRVETGIHRDGTVEIRSGLAAGSWIIFQGHGKLVDGMRVEARLPDGTPFGGKLAAASDEPEAAVP